MIIAHRCNLEGKSDHENTLSGLIDCINQGFSVEIDVRYIGGKYYLGHDLPQEEISVYLMSSLSDRLFIHCKNIEALQHLRAYEQLNIFGHSEDEFVITSKGDVFCSVGTVHEHTICVMPELSKRSILIDNMINCSHVLTDYAYRYRDEINNYHVRPEC